MINEARCERGMTEPALPMPGLRIVRDRDFLIGRMHWNCLINRDIIRV